MRLSTWALGALMTVTLLAGTQNLNAQTVTTFYSESFENGDGGWTEPASPLFRRNSNWEIAAPAGSVINAASDGQNAWVTGASAPYNDNARAAVVSPVIDLSSAVNPVLTLDVWWEAQDLQDGAFLEVSTNGTSFTKVGSDPDFYNLQASFFSTSNFVSAWSGTTAGGQGSNGYRTVAIAIPSQFASATFQFRIVFQSANDGTANSDGFAFDNVKITEGLTGSKISAFPYAESFEQANGAWVSGFDFNFSLGNSWELETPFGQVIKNASDGNFAWTTGPTAQGGLEAYSDDEFSFVNSPCFDLTSLVAPTMTFDIWWESTFQFDGTALQYTIDGGQTWISLPSENVRNYSGIVEDQLGLFEAGFIEAWTGNDAETTGTRGGYVPVTVDLTAIPAGQRGNVYFRFLFIADSDPNNGLDGVAFDNIQIFEGQTVDPIVINGLQNVMADNDAGQCGSSSVNLPNVTATGGQGTVTVSNDAPSTFPVGTTTVTFTATDEADGSVSGSIEVTVNDTENPVLSGCSENIEVMINSGQDGAEVSFDAPTADDNCPNPTVEQTAGLASGSLFPVGETTVTYTATDASGNTATCSFTVTVAVRGELEITGLNDISVANDAGLCGAAVSLPTPNVVGAEGEVTLENDAPDFFPVGTTVVTFTASDATERTAMASINVTVNDTEAPILDGCSSDISLEVNDDQNGASVTFDSPSVEDNCPGAMVEQTAGPASGSMFPVGNTTVTFTATDAAGNTDNCSFVVSITQRGSISITGIKDTTVANQPGLCGDSLVLPMPMVIGAEGEVSIESDALDFFPVGTTVVTYTATDALNRTAVASINVTVEDTEAPILSNGPIAGLVEDFFLPADTASAVNYLDPVASDNCDDDVNIEFVSGLGNGSVFPTGISKETYRATDEAGNATEASFNVGLLPFVQDFPYVEDFENGNGGFAAGTPGSATVSSWEFGTPAGTEIMGAASGNNAWATGLSTPYADNEQSFIVSPFFLIDGISLEEPTVSVDIWWESESFFAGTTLQASIDGGITWETVGDELNEFYNGVVFLNIPEDEVTEDNFFIPAWTGTAQDALGPEGYVTRTLDISDLIGDNVQVVLFRFLFNSGEPFFTETNPFDGFAFDNFRIFDGTALQFANLENVVSENDPGLCGDSLVLDTADVVGNIGDATITNNAPEFFPVGVTEVIFTATTEAGQSVSDTITVTVNDTEAPTLSNGPIAGLVEDFFLPSDVASVVNYLDPVVADNCPDATVAFISGLGNGSEFPLGISKETYRATDKAGNELEACFNVGLLPFVQDFPYVQDFENGDGGFAAGTPGCATVSSWEFGTPAGSVISGAASGNNAWATGLSTPYADNEQSFIVSPFFLIDGVSLSQPALSVDIWWESESFFAGTTLQASIDGGITWETLGDELNEFYNGVVFLEIPQDEVTEDNFFIPAWTGTAEDALGPDGYVNRQIDLSDLIGDNVQVVLFRFLFNSGTPFFNDTNPFDGFAFDNFSIFDASLKLEGLADITVSNDSAQCGAEVELPVPTIAAGAIGEVTITNDAPSFFPIDTTVVTYTATTEAGQIGTASINVIVNDTEFPSVTNGPIAGVVDDFFLPADEASVVNYFGPIVTDNCPDATIEFIGGLGNGSEFPLGISKESYRATDKAGNQVDACFNVGLLPFVQDFPYVQDFENGNGGFAAGTPGCNVANSWEFGTPAGSVISGAASGNNAWATGLSTPYADNEQSFIVSPFFLLDGASLEQPTLSVDIWWESESFFAGTTLQASVDGGITWETLGDELNEFYNGVVFLEIPQDEVTEDNFFIPAWTGTAEDALGPGGFVNRSIDLSDLIGDNVQVVLFRFLFNSGTPFFNDTNPFDGFAFDNFQIFDGAQTSTSGFTLVNAVNDEVLAPVNEGDVIILDEQPTSSFNIVADITGDAASVALSIRGRIIQDQVENAAPYSVFGDVNGDFNGNLLPPGDYSITATPFSEPNGQGFAGNPLTVNFSVQASATQAPEVIELVLVNADTDMEILTLTEGAQIDLAAIGTANLSIVAKTNPFPVGSVSMDLSGALSESRIENLFPYALFGDSGKGDFFAGSFVAGNYNITAAAFAERKGMGTKQDPALSINFTVVGTPPATSLKIYPNEVDEAGVVTFEGRAINENALIQVIDVLGREVYSVKVADEFSTKTVIGNTGTYIVRLTDGDKIVNKRMMVK